jgi:hypothetical protein
VSGEDLLKFADGRITRALTMEEIRQYRDLLDLEVDMDED